MKQKGKHLMSLIVLLSLFQLLIVSCNNSSEKEATEQLLSVTDAEPGFAEKSSENAIEAPPFSEGIFPCSDCHSEMEPNPKRRELVDMHDDIDAIFDHDRENRWCIDCHNLANRDSLKLASGKLIGFDESYKLCGQCHGDKLRDWKVGVHGKRTGEWNGKKEYLLCVHCHNPHSPKFKELTPEPPPMRQEEIN